jgi:hypothetical protein
LNCSFTDWFAKKKKVHFLKAVNFINRLQLVSDNHFSSGFIGRDFRAFDIFNRALCIICVCLACIIGSNYFALFASLPI